MISSPWSIMDDIAPSEQEITFFLQSAYQEVGNNPFNQKMDDIEFVQNSNKLKCAAVLVPLIKHAGEWHLVLTRRTECVESHKGQVSFPGGGCDQGEINPEQTALREAHEELGIAPYDVKVLGRLNEMITITDFRVTPVVGVIPWPYSFNISTTEVSSVFSIPLKWLSTPQNWEESVFAMEGKNRQFTLIRYHPYNGEILWGASARITQDFLKTIRLIN